MTERHVRIVWPEARYVPESQLRLWFQDAIDNGEIEADMIDGSDSLEHACRELNYCGTITLHRTWRNDL